MTSREKALSVYPDAEEQMASTHSHVTKRHYIVVPSIIPSDFVSQVVGEGDSFPEAWDDAASKLPPGSPAGETASEPTCVVRAGLCPNPPTTYGQGHWCGKSDFHLGPHKCRYCDREFNADSDFTVETQERNASSKMIPVASNAAVPEPVPTEGATERCIHCGAIPIVGKRKPTEKEIAYGLLLETSLPSAPEAAAAPIPKGTKLAPKVGRLHICNANCSSPCPVAATVAPAAEELIQELRDKVRELEDALMYATEGEENPSVAYANCIEGGKSLRKTTEYEIARAEEYRKGAKNEPPTR